MIENKMLENRIILLGEHLDDYLANDIVLKMLYLESKNPYLDIKLYINSGGGSVSAGLAIFDTMRYIRCDVSTICVGTAASMAAFLLSCGTHGKRYALPNAEIMIHQPHSGAQGQITDLEIQVKHFQRVKKRMVELFAENTKKSLTQIEHDIDRDNFMSAQEAVEYGLIDKIIY